MPSGVSASTVFTLLGFCFSVLFIFFVCSRLVCALFHRRRRLPLVVVAAARYSFPVPVSTDRQGQAAAGGRSGLDPAAVAAFPTRGISASASAL